MNRLLLLLLVPVASGCILLAPPHRVAGLPSPSEVAATAPCPGDPAARHLPAKRCRDEYRYQ